MNTTLKIIILIILIVFIGKGAYEYMARPVLPIQKACTMEAMLCPDGSYVSRTGPNCEFAACPTQKTRPPTIASGIRGTVTRGPICPVERIPPDPICADQPFATALSLTGLDGLKVIKYFSSDADGKFAIDVPPGEYRIRQTIGIVSYPRCASDGTIVVKAGTYAETTVSCDTGIR